ncbi:MAG: choice-of-anchor D domain-containing protein [bacterium]
MEWQRTYGGNLGDGAKSIQQTSDSGYIVTGYRQTEDYNWTTDVFLYKLDKSGNVEWERNYGGVYQDAGYSVQQTKDGGYILAGERNNDNGINLPAGWWVAKLNNVGIIEWSQLYNGWMAKAIQQTKDGGYIVAGWSAKKGIGISILKLDSQGKIEWEHSNKADSLCNFNSVIQTKDGGYVAVGVVKHNFNPIDVSDYYIVKYNSDGNKIWEQIYGGDQQDIGYSILQTREGGFIVTGETFSDNRDVYENKGKSDYWLLKLNSQGIIDWRKNIGGSGEEGTHDYYNTSSIIQTSDGGYIFTGTTNSVDGDVSENKGYQDLWVVRLDETGKVNWEKTYGGSTVDFAEQVQPTKDGGFVIAGASFSNNGDLIENLGMSDIWLLKFGLKLPILPEDVSDAVFSIVAPEPVSKNIDMKKCIVGMSKDSVIDNFISNIGSYKFMVDSIYLRGFDSKAFSLVSGLPKYSLEPGESKNTEFRFIPLREGKHFAEIVIITQSDTLIQTIEGEGIAPKILVLSKNIDFGLVNMGKSEDTLQAMTIKNIGTAPITITNTKHNKPNDYDFSTISGGWGFTLNPGDTAKLDLRFTPSFIGRTSGTLEFHYNDIGSPAIVMLFGEGIEQTPQIRATRPQFVDLICDNSTSTTVEIKSTGGDTLRIKGLNLTGPDKADFSINELMPINLAPDSSKTISIGFKTNVPGIKTAALEIKSNADPDSVITIPITARKDSVALVPSPTLIDLGTIFPNQTKDTSFIISNLGTIQTDGKVTLSNNLTCTNPTFNIDSGGVYELDFTFTGIPADGNICEKITVWDEVCKYYREVIIAGKVVSPQLKGFSATQCKSYSDKYTLILNNNTSNRLNVTSIVFDKNPQLFEIDPSLVFPIAIEPFNTNNEIKVKYQDNIAQKFKTAVNCYTDNKYIPVLTDTIFAETLEYIRYTSGLINDTVHKENNPFAVGYDSASLNKKNKFTYAIKVNESANDMDYLTGLSDLEVIINYNTNILGANFDSQSGNVKVRLGEDLQGTYSFISAKEIKIDEFNSQIIVNLENVGKPIAINDAFKLLEIDFTAYLSKNGLSDDSNSAKSRSAIISYSINSSDKCISYKIVNNAMISIGQFCMDVLNQIKIPEDPSNRFYLSEVIPHPIGTQDATIDYGLGFECQVTLTIYDISGAIILTPVNEIQKPGTHKQAISRKLLSAGAYFIEMKAGPFKETKKIIVE